MELLRAPVLCTLTPCFCFPSSDNPNSGFQSNPVVANVVAALSEIAESHPSSNLLDLNPQSINKLLTALNECTEWGQIFILDCLANYTPKDDREAQR
ncbi:AP-1 complex subunit beta-1-like [Trachypithecus francoisi]|uniref:AP-1 complex subunit beta-1-like n=1 Tax=Trachypithecus francoisi TaxID=54180 RepID=UPI00141B13CE|nr:AP-1 complex subunit beta-1-like [Trachypithecus francoisi]